LTTNLGIASWGKIFDDPMVAAAMLDRLLHRSVVFNIDGESYRMRSHRARSEATRKAVHQPTRSSLSSNPRSSQVGNFDDREWGISGILVNKGASRRALSQETACVLSWWCPVWRWRELVAGAGRNREPVVSITTAS